LGTLDKEPPPKVIVDPPLAEPLARGVVVVQYRAENFRIVPEVGTAALAVSPRIGHLHVTVDNLPWHFVVADDSNSIIVAGLPAGPAPAPCRTRRPDTSGAGWPDRQIRGAGERPSDALTGERELA
jgi:hypothetical protein